MGETFFNPFSLEGKTILVTGASSGIGKAIAIACSRMGATIMLNGRSTERLQAVKERLQGEKHAIFPIDLQNPEGCQSLAERLTELDGIVYCAGIGQRKLCKMITPSDVDEVMDINFKANVMLQAQLLSFRKIRKEASIVFIASKAASSPSFGNAIYSASKGAVISYAKCLALEMAPRKIRVNCICPAMVWTDLIIQGGITKEDLEIEQLKYPLKRYGQPEDIAYLAIYLLSDASSWMTGTSVDITGGGE